MPAASAFVRVPLAVLATLARLTRALAWALVIGIGLFAALLLVVRLVVFPNIDRFRDDITAAIAREVHQPVAVDTLGTGWDGWNPKLVIHGFRMGAQGGQGGALLELPRLELTLAWTSLPFLDLRMKQMVIEDPRLAIRRDPQGVLHFAGIEIDPAQATDDSGMSAWLLRQREIVVRNALITWTDERRGAPQLVLDQVDFRLENRFGRRQFGLTGSPPSELAAPIDVRGDFAGPSLADWQHARGRLYVRLDYADLAAWREWLPLPVEVNRGKGALRAWFTLVDGQAREVVADLELADVRTRLAPGLPELALARIGGRAGWRYAPETREIFGRSLGFTTGDGFVLDPTNISVLLHTDAQGATETGRLEFDRLALAPLRELAFHLPFPERWRTELRALALQGTLTRGLVQWEGAADAPKGFEMVGELAQVGTVPHGAWPGFTNISGSLKANAQGGSMRLDTRDARVVAPEYFAAPITLDQAKGEFSWTVTPERVSVRVADLAVANADAAGRLRATYRSAAKGPGEIDLDATLSRAAPQALPRYLPIILPEGARTWVAQAVKPGTVADVRLKLKGDLAQFPVPGDRGGIFAIDIKGRDFGLDYASDWPALADVDGEVHFRGAGMRIDGTHGRVYGVQIGRATVSIADLREPVLEVDGEAAGATTDFLRFMEQSPVGEWTGHFTKGARAAGDGRLALKFSLPLHDVSANEVAGDFTFVNDDLDLPGVPSLRQLNGRVEFTKEGVSGRDIVASALGGPVRVALATSDGRVRIDASGNADIQAVRREFDLPFGNRVTGSADWTFALDARGDATSWVLESPLTGVAIDLPSPLHKRADETLPLRIDRPRPSGAKEDLLFASLGDVAHLSALRRLDVSPPRVDRAVVALGRAPRAPDPRTVRPGLWLRAALPVFDADEWLATGDAANAGSSTAVENLALAGVDIEASRLTALGRDFTDLKVTGRRAADQWRFDLEGQEVAGTATWSGPNAQAPNGVVVARLARFTTPPARESGPDSAAPASPDHGATHWPELDITADAFSSKKRNLGRLELVARPRPDEWRIERLLVANDSGRIEANGAWKRAGRGERTDRTELDVVLDVRDAGAFLARFGHPGAVQGAPTHMTGQLAWAGDPSDFDYPTLSGTFHIDVGSGRFLKVEPGIGKLLGVLSLQALPRRISLDFRDIFSEGFTFDRVTGNVRIAEGVMTTDDFRLAGPSAQVAIAGEADLARETQRLRVRVQPTLSAGVSAGAALLFLANPVVGAAVGAGSLLAQKVLRDPIEQMFSYQYTVTGSWSDPQVARTSTATAAVPPEASNKSTP